MLKGLLALLQANKEENTSSRNSFKRPQCILETASSLVTQTKGGVRACLVMGLKGREESEGIPEFDSKKYYGQMRNFRTIRLGFFL